VNDVFGKDQDRVQMEKVMMLLWQFRDDPTVVQFMAQFVAKVRVSCVLWLCLDWSRSLSCLRASLSSDVIFGSCRGASLGDLTSWSQSCVGLRLRRRVGLSRWRCGSLASAFVFHFASSLVTIGLYLLRKVMLSRLIAFVRLTLLCSLNQSINQSPVRWI
jgi:hypothetical protein